MADYVEQLCGHHGGPKTGAAEQGAFVHDLMRSYEVALLQPVLDAVKDRNAVRLIGPSDASVRAPTVALSLNHPAEPVAAELAQHGIMAGGGDFYASRPLQAMGVDPAQGVLRISFTHYTAKNEIDQLLGALERVL
jgi:selenocysteine lyase/cysteine desulfurase